MSTKKWSDAAALMCGPGELRRKAEAVGALLVGVAGFSGSWKHNPRVDAESAAQNALRRLFEEAVDAQGEQPVWCVSGATNAGVPGIAYEVAEELGLQRVGVTAAAASSHPLASLHHLVVIGERFGDESRVFVGLCHRFWLVGGGAQSEKEALMAHDQGTPIVAVDGLGGAAESLSLDGIRRLEA